MTEDLRRLYKFVSNYYWNMDWNADNKKQRYGVELYERILELSGLCVELIEENRNFHITAPPLIRSLIEASVDIENLRYVRRYSKLMDLVSVKEELGFIERYSRTFKEQVTTPKEYPLRHSLLKISGKYERLKTEVLEIFDDEGKGVRFVSQVAYKFTLLDTRRNRKRHAKYEMFYDLLCAHSHNNLRFISKAGLKKVADIKKYEIYYIDLIASTLKNGLIHLVNIFNEKMDKEDFEELKSLKWQILDPDTDDNDSFLEIYYEELSSLSEDDSEEDGDL